MSPELERRLVEKYPKLYAGCSEPPSRSLMAFGFECEDGWFDLIDTLSEHLLTLATDLATREPKFSGTFTATQVKEKYGTLRFYVGPCTDEAFAIIHFAEGLSARVCETCGNRGRTRGTTWFKTLCENCAEKQGYTEEVRGRLQ